MLPGFILAVITIVIAAAMYNQLIALRNKCEEGYADIDTQLKRRYDLIPNLVQTVQGYASHEKDTLDKVVQARTMAMNAQGVKDQEQAENMLTGALKSIFALAENYPELKANENFLQLQQTLEEVEGHIQMSRRYYNGTVRDLNTKIQTIPYNIVAMALNFKEKEYFQINEDQRENVTVNFNNTTNQQQPAPNQAPAAPNPAPATQNAATPPNQSPAQTAQPAPAPSQEPVANSASATPPTQPPAQPTASTNQAAPAEQPPTKTPQNSDQPETSDQPENPTS